MSAKNYWSKFKLLMWKNFLLHYRRPIQTIVEVFVPAMLICVLVVIRGHVHPEHHADCIFQPYTWIPESINTTHPWLPESFTLPESTTEEDFFLLKAATNQTAIEKAAPRRLISFDKSKSLRSLFPEAPKLAFSPANSETLQIIASNYDRYVGIFTYNTSQELETHFFMMTNTFAAFDVEPIFEQYNGQNYPDNLEVAIRFPSELRLTESMTMSENSWQTNILFPLHKEPGPRNYLNNTGASPFYLSEGFLGLQASFAYYLAFYDTDYKYIYQYYNEGRAPHILLQRFPYPAWVTDPLIKAMTNFVPAMIMLSFAYSCVNIVKLITAEKENQLKETMKIMGLPNWLLWLTWFLTSLIFLTISIIMITVLLKVRWYSDNEFSLFTFTDSSVLFVFMFLYICSTITYCFAISSMFSKANSAATAGGIFWIVSFFPYFFLVYHYETLSLFVKLLASLAPNTAMGFGFQLMIMYESVGTGISWENINKPVDAQDTLTVLYLMIMIVADTLIYLLIAIYVEYVFPGEFGVSHPWDFLFTKEFWQGTPQKTSKIKASTMQINLKNMEVEPKDIPRGIVIEKLRKVFNQKVAVRGLTMNMYKGQITVILGHNGAGKTTIMSMLTGMIPPTSGTAYIQGHDIRTNMDSARTSLGLCPQHNILFNDLTVGEHLYFFSKLKGIVNRSELKSEVDNYINFVKLRPKAKSKASQLSGGMKRKLCVAIALCGNSEVVILDEPTAGMDPAARRVIWNLLQSEKKNRTIILSTHFMDEADLLGDRIAIMAAGELQCCGSSFFLKKRYGAGYNLIIEKDESCKPAKITKVLSHYIQDIRVQTNVGTELTFLLEMQMSYKFEKMLRELEDYSKELGIKSYGISLTTLEEVFLKVGTHHSEHIDPGKKLLLASKIIDWFQENKVHSDHFKKYFHKFEPIVGGELMFNQSFGMFIKKLVTTLRQWQFVLIQNLVPIIFLILAILILKSSQTIKDLPPFVLTLDKYPDSVILVSNKTNNSFMPFFKKLVKDYQVIYTEDISRKILELTREDSVTANRRYLLGFQFDTVEVHLPDAMPFPATINSSRIIVFFNNNPLHTPAIGMGLALNTFLTKIERHRIKWVNWPFPYSSNEKAKHLYSGQGSGFQMAFNIAFSMAFVTAFYIIILIRERTSGAKHLQYIAGCGPGVYWFNTFLFDLCTFCITILCVLITLACFQQDGFSTLRDLARVLFILWTFTFHVFPLTYVFNFFFDSPAGGFSTMALYGIFTGPGLFLVTVMMKTPSINLRKTANKLHWPFLLFPHYNLATAVQNSYIGHAYEQICDIFLRECALYAGHEELTCYQKLCEHPRLKKRCCGETISYYQFKYPGIGYNLLFFLVYGTLAFIILFLIENRIFRHCRIRRKGVAPADPDKEDIDVAEEKQLIRTIPEADRARIYTLVLQNVTKLYGKIVAVNNICVGVKEHECFGLLGVNGAGKTTTFKMMTGDEEMSYGDAWVKEVSIKTKISQVQEMSGYCPQFDALLEEMTAKELLVMFALLRGVEMKYCGSLARKLAIDFCFEEHMNKQICHLSGGNKRKVSAALALTGRPDVIYLDEPTAGIDPEAKRHLWNAICKVRDHGKCVILTTHLMEECEALCTRIAIMVNGSFKCLGSTQHLKNKFARGYTLTVKVKRSEEGYVHDTEVVEEYILKQFKDTFLREKFQEMLTFQISDQNLRCSKMFGIMEKCKKALNIEDYSLGQSSLEQVFLTFTQVQRGGPESTMDLG